MKKYCKSQGLVYDENTGNCRPSKRGKKSKFRLCRGSKKKSRRNFRKRFGMDPDARLKHSAKDVGRRYRANLGFLPQYSQKEFSLLLEEGTRVINRFVDLLWESQFFSPPVVWRSAAAAEKLLPDWEKEKDITRKYTRLCAIEMLDNYLNTELRADLDCVAIATAIIATQTIAMGDTLGGELDITGKYLSPTEIRWFRLGLDTLRGMGKNCEEEKLKKIYLEILKITDYKTCYQTRLKSGDAAALQRDIPALQSSTPPWTGIQQQEHDKRFERIEELDTRLKKIIEAVGEKYSTLKKSHLTEDEKDEAAKWAREIFFMSPHKIVRRAAVRRGGKMVRPEYSKHTTSADEEYLGTGKFLWKGETYFPPSISGTYGRVGGRWGAATVKPTKENFDEILVSILYDRLTKR